MKDFHFQSSNSIWFSGHLGLGDTLICAGIIRHLANMYDLVVVPAKPNNVESVSYLFHDDPRIIVRYVLDDDDAHFIMNEVWKGHKLVIGQWGQGFNGSEFDRSFYAQAGLDFDVRWTGFALKREKEQEIQNFYEPPYVFVHQDKKRGFLIEFGRIPSILTVVQPNKVLSNNLFAYVPAILGATEIHVINSSFALMVDSLPDSWWPGGKVPPLYLHTYARPGGEMPIFRKQWIKLD